MSDGNESQHVCVIGLGDMGSALAEALLASGHRVTVWNRTKSRSGPLGEKGASVAESVPDAVAEARIVVVCVLDHEATMSVLLSNEVAESLRGKLLVQLSTVTADESRALGHWAEENGVDYLDGSILGYRQDVLRSSCPIVYSGSKATFEANEKVLAAIGGDARLVSEKIGSATTFDKTLYSFHYGSMLAFFHGAAMCHAAGYPIELFAELVLGKGGENTKGAQRRYGELIAKRSYDADPDIDVSLHVDMKAYEHVLRLSEELDIDTALPRTVVEYFNRAVAEGHDQQTLAGIFELMIRRNS